MEHLEVNHETMVSAEVEMVLNGKFSGSYRVIFRDLDADAIIEVRYFNRARRADAIAYAKTLATGKVAA
jgi:hypothetical protein